ncbi:FtsK/SpoIIIE domain-containing protein [Streptomyces yaizuensis]|uniref:Plasmid transfer protein n=1 Tax=Streptomyces yaizuensis TaxID=2989713 RepID=A0ABQ5P2A5_9ACTN|nr:FtsK/SpoIIIE domain-containing protein [Streptomyces sp. YSPA8]GLF96734.1 plasmid transfer protein [Streptomyces sp. YSPA8]
MSDLVTAAEVAGVLSAAGGLGYAKVRAPRVWWSLVGLPVTRVRFALTYESTMDVCGLTVQPTRARAALLRATRKEVLPVPPRVRRVRMTSTGLRVTLRLAAGLEPADLVAASARLRHAFGVYSIVVVDTKPGLVELRMTGYDVLRRVRMPRILHRPRTGGPLMVPVALREDGGVFVRNYLRIPHALTLGANQSGKSMYQRNLIRGLASRDVALVGIDCKRGVEQIRFVSRFSAFATDPETAAGLLDALVGEMEDRFDLLSLHQVSDLWELPEDARPVPVVVFVDEVAELFLTSAKADEDRRDRMVKQLIRLAQMARAVGIYLEICGQRFGSELGRGATMLRAQLTGRVCHRVNDKQTAEMGLGDISPEAMVAATQIRADRPGLAVAGDASGGWSRIRTPKVTTDETAAACRRYAYLTPDLPALAAFRPPAVSPGPGDALPLDKSRPVAD